MSSIVLGELYFGAFKSVRAGDNLRRIEELAASTVVLGCDRSTARDYGSLKNRLREKGRPLPDNDVWIAATARQYALVLVTRDDHFAEVEDLDREAW